MYVCTLVRCLLMRCQENFTNKKLIDPFKVTFYGSNFSANRTSYFLFSSFLINENGN